MKYRSQSDRVLSVMAANEQRVTKAEWVARLELLGIKNRAAYRQLREIAWKFVVENSSRSDFPRKFS